MKSIFTKEQISKIIELYQLGKSCTKIGKIFNCTPGTISSHLKKSGITVINKQNQLTYNLSEMIQKYNNGSSLSEIAQLCNVTVGAISMQFKKAKINVINRHNICKFNEHIFDSIDTEEKAYWLGFIFADGYVSDNNDFELSLKSDDFKHLQKFNTFMQYNGDNVKLGSVTCNNKICERCRWSIRNKYFVNTLKSLGCIPRKSLQLTFPDISIFKNSILIWDFIRGYFDGDGCIYFQKQNPCIQILSTKSFLEKIQELCFGIGFINNKSHSGKAYSFSIYKHLDVIKFLNSIYKNSTIYLDRKYDRYKLSICRLSEESDKLLSFNIGESCDANPEINKESKESLSS